MIDSIRIQNFQKHRDSTLQLCPHVNIIAGETDGGKSAIIRALQWVLCNRPNNDSFRSHGIDGKTETKVTLRIKDTRISRIRDGKKTNTYEVQQNKEDPQIYKALRGEVPQEIQNVININSVNIQGQFEGHFLLTQSPGEVARYLNKIVELDSIDVATKKASSFVSQAKTWEKDTQLRINQFNENLASLEWLDDAFLLVDVIESLQEQLNTARTEEKGLRQTIKAIEGADVSEAFWLPASFMDGVRSLDIEIVTVLRELINDAAQLRQNIKLWENMEEATLQHDQRLGDLQKQISENEGLIEFCPECGRVLE